jgi:hypothetical protein
MSDPTRTVPRDQDPEGNLLLASTGIGDVSREAIHAALSVPLDWTRVVRLTLAHRMAPALLTALGPSAQAQVPGDVLHALRVHCQRLRHQSGALVRELFDVLGALEERSVVATPFKGPLLGELLFGEAAARTPGDLDLLVHHGDVTAVRETLQARGYVDADQRPDMPPLSDVQRRMYERYQCEYLFVRARDEMAIEPHWDLSQRPLALDVDYGGMLDRAGPVRFGGRTVSSLAPPDLLIALCVHGAKHQWERLAWIRDVAGVLAKWPDLDLEAVVERARRQGYARLLLLSFAVVRECAEVALPGAVRQAIAADPAIAVLVRRIVDGLFLDHRTEPRNDRVDSFRLQLRERWSDRMRYTWRTRLTPRRYHLELVALPGRLCWLYYPLKWGTDFAVAPAWSLVKPVIRPIVNRRRDYCPPQ